MKVKERKKSPALAAILSIIFPGTGALYNEQYTKGILYILIFAGLVTMQGRGGAQPFLGLLLAGFYFFQIIDAVHVAKNINRLCCVETGEAGAVPTEEITPTIRTGSIFWGLLLMALGVILLLANFDIISYGKIFDLWPLVVIIIGLKLLADYFSRKQ